MGKSRPRLDNMLTICRNDSFKFSVEGLNLTPLSY